MEKVTEDIEVEEVTESVVDSEVTPQDVVDVQVENDTKLEEQALELKARESELFRKECSMTLRENGLEMFDGIINISDPNHLDELVHNLSKVVKDIKVGSGYIPPKENIKQAQYDVDKQNGDTKGMIKSLFGFGR